MVLTEDRQEFVKTASVIHDSGKASISPGIFSKPAKLSEEDCLNARKGLYNI
jgi:HD-GYP domain-containing protein (c-di-GMP phosphodiesterase class II)